MSKAPVMVSARTMPTRTYHNIVYARHEEAKLRLDMARPAEGDGPFPGLVFIAGGGWHAVEKSDWAEEICYAARRGYFAATIEHRVAPQHPFPAPLEDVLCAVAWLRDRAASYGLDPERLGVVGNSSGAHLALLAAFSPADAQRSTSQNATGGALRAVVNVYGPTELVAAYYTTRKENRSLLRGFLGGTPTELPDRYVQASPLTYVGSHCPPVLTLHGELDEVVPIEQARLLDRAMRQAGADHKLIIGSEAAHELAPRDRVAEAVYAFLDAHLEPAPQSHAGCP
jgi:acetyl esterase/lipase